MRKHHRCPQNRGNPTPCSFVAGRSRSPSPKPARISVSKPSGNGLTKPSPARRRSFSASTASSPSGPAISWHKPPSPTRQLGIGKKPSPSSTRSVPCGSRCGSATFIERRRTPQTCAKSRQSASPAWRKRSASPRSVQSRAQISTPPRSRSNGMDQARADNGPIRRTASSFSSF